MNSIKWNNTIWIQRTLDAGAMGLVVPMVNSAEDAKKVVANMKFATQGRHSWGGSRLADYLETDYRQWTDDDLTIMVMIETVQAVENDEAILSVEDVTGGFIGPADLARSMGVTETGPGTAHEAAILEVLAVAQKVGKVAGKNETSDLSQSFTIPSGTSVYLTYYYQIRSSGTCDHDYERILVNSTEIKTYNLCSDNQNTTWAVDNVDMSGYGGQTITIHFSATTDADDISSLFLDDVSFQASPATSSAPVNVHSVPIHNPQRP